jgi:hypothetical protein
MSKKNPFAKVTFKQPVIASDMRRSQGSERFVGKSGELNASSTKDLFVQMSAFLEQASETGAITETAAIQRQELAAQHEKAVTAAFAAKDSHAELGEVMAEELYQAANREGFMRRFLARQDLKQGQHPQVRMRMKDVTAVVATSPVQTQAQIIRDNLYTPPEFYITARPFIEQREIEQSLGDVLEEKYLEGLEATMVSEDRIWRTLAIQATGISNPLTLFSGTMTAGGLMTLRNQVGRWNIPVSSWLIANDVWTDIVADTSFQQVIDPVSKHELLLTGMLGSIFGMSIYSDAYRHPQHKVLSQGEMFVIGDTINHGQYTDRGGVNSQPIDGSIEKVPGRGWFLTETISMVIANSRSVAYGIRS